MSQEKAREIIADSRYAVLATCVDDQPRVRPMMFVVTEDFKFWCSTVNISGKMQEFAKNSRVEILWVDSRGNQLRAEGLLDASGGAEKKRRLFELHPGMRGLFADEHDPRLVHVEVVPTRVRWKPSGFSEYNPVPV
jgi:uncharacterized pyridoxamine 5'-phosphate oxidase family protein